LDLRLEGVKVEESDVLAGEISGRIEVEQLYPSWLIFAGRISLSAVSSV